MLRVITANLNGVRSAASKGFFEWLATQEADIVCVQELKAQDKDITAAMRHCAGLDGHFFCAQKPGYSGVGIYSRHAGFVQCGFNNAEFDAEGRTLQLDFDYQGQALSVVSLYVPSGSSSEDRQAAKFRFLADFYPHLAQLKARQREVIICADWNIAAQQIDLKNWKGNLKNSGFLPEERAWIAQVLSAQGWTDAYRQLYPTLEGESYTWWSNRGQAWANNVGWRLDYQLVSAGLAKRIHAASVYKTQRFSDHAPLVVDYAL